MKLRSLYPCLIIFVFDSVYAAQSITGNVTNFETFVLSLLRKICLLAGVGLCVGALIQYRQHRQNPMNVRLTTPVWFLIIGLCLIGINYMPAPLPVS